MSGLRIANGYEFPESIVTETVAMLAKRGMGKSNAGVVMAEEMWDHGQQWVAIDPKGDWFGIRSSANGKGPGLPVPIFGGRHGDIPLEASAGHLMASLIVERGLTCVLDVSLFSKGDQIRFLTDFAEALFRMIEDDRVPCMSSSKRPKSSARSDGQRVDASYDKLGKQVVVGSIRVLKGRQVTTITSSTAETTIVTAAGAGVHSRGLLSDTPTLPGV